MGTLPAATRRANSYTYDALGRQETVRTGKGAMIDCLTRDTGAVLRDAQVTFDPLGRTATITSTEDGGVTQIAHAAPR
jgi:hypothetical protein